MNWISMYGTGATIHGIEPSAAAPGRAEFESWLSVFWVPIIPLSSWSAVYAGEAAPDGITHESHCFADLRRLPRNWRRIGRTFVRGMLVALLAVIPIAVMIAITNGRAATKFEFAIVLAATCWAVGLIFWSERVRRKRLHETRIALGERGARRA